MQKLTRAEEELMHRIWELEKAFLKDIIDGLPEPRPAQSTVATILKIMETKGFVGHKVYGKSHEYFPIISRKEYSKAYFGQFLNNYFGGSFKKMLHFYMQEEDLDLQTLDELIRENSASSNLKQA